jgi:hypothetical protein
MRGQQLAEHPELMVAVSVKYLWNWAVEWTLEFV